MRKKKLQDSSKSEEARQPDINVAVCTPSIGMMRTRYTSSLVRMMVHYMNTPILGQENALKTLSYHVIEGSMVPQARESFVKDVLDVGSTHLLFIDEDMGFREDCLNIMLSRQMPFVACNYRMKVPPCPFVAMGLDDKTRIETNEDKTSLEEALYTGFGFALLERQVFENLKPPSFSNEWYPSWQAYSTEDRTFCLKAREAGFPCMIDHKASKRIYHIGSWAYSWDDEIPASKATPIAERYQAK